MMEITPPREETSDKILSLVKAGLELLPGGPLFGYFVNTFLPLQLQKRTQEWMQQVSNGLSKVTHELDSLRENQRFMTILLQATQVALRNHQSEKLEALRNAVVNSIPPPSYEESLQVHFVHLVDRFTEWHLRILRLFSDNDWLAKAKLGPFGHGRDATERVIKNQFPELSDKSILIDLVLADLQSTRLIVTRWNDQGPIALQAAASTPTITPIGRDFLNFIEQRPSGNSAP